MKKIIQKAPSHWFWSHVTSSFSQLHQMNLVWVWKSFYIYGLELNFIGLAEGNTVSLPSSTSDLQSKPVSNLYTIPSQGIMQFPENKGLQIHKKCSNSRASIPEWLVRSGIVMRHKFLPDSVVNNLKSLSILCIRASLVHYAEYLIICAATKNANRYHTKSHTYWYGDNIRNSLLNILDNFILSSPQSPFWTSSKAIGRGYIKSNALVTHYH